MTEKSKKQDFPYWGDKERRFVHFFMDKINYRLGRDEVCRMLEEARQEAHIDDELSKEYAHCTPLWHIANYAKSK